MRAQRAKRPVGERLHSRGERVVDLAREFGVHTSTVSRTARFLLHPVDEGTPRGAQA